MQASIIKTNILNMYIVEVKTVHSVQLIIAQHVILAFPRTIATGPVNSYWPNYIFRPF